MQQMIKRANQIRYIYIYMYIVYIRTFICIHTYTHTHTLSPSLYTYIYIHITTWWILQKFLCGTSWQLWASGQPLHSCQKWWIILPTIFGWFFFAKNFRWGFCMYVYIYTFFSNNFGDVFVYIFLPTISGDVVVFGTFKSIIYRKKPLGF